jgi:putative N6-adenine-specific DNA methylase
MSPTTYLIFVSCALGLEELLARELTDLGFRVSTDPKAEGHEVGGLELRTDEAGIWAICLRSRLAEGVRVRQKSFHARSFSDLSAQLKKLPFRAFFQPSTAVSIRVTCHRSRLWHSEAVRERVAEVLADHAGFSVTTSPEATCVYVRLDDDCVQVSLDASARLHRRGYREQVERASLRETLAAAVWHSARYLVLSKGQSGQDPPQAVDLKAVPQAVLWDPFCGAGTILLEALHETSGLLAGALRSFPFERFRSFDQEEFATHRAQWERDERKRPRLSLRAIGSDISERALAATSHNAHTAGVQELLQLHQGSVDEVVARIPQGAWVVTNPPYGKRLRDARPIQELQGVLEARTDLKPALVLCGGAARDVLPKSAPALFRTKNGGLAVSARLLRGP